MHSSCRVSHPVIGRGRTLTEHSCLCRDVWRSIGIYVFAVPILIYTVIKAEYHNSDRKYGRKEREFM